MDKKDREILYQLTIDSRISFSSLAKKVGLKQETVRYRVKSLIDEGIITQFHAIINSSKLGITYYKMFLRLKNSNQEKRDEIITYLKNNKRVTWVGRVDGEYDVGVNVLVESISKLDEFLEEFLEKYSKYVFEKSISANVSGEYLMRKYLSDSKKSETMSYESEGNSDYKVDEIDFNILKILCSNSRLPSVAIGSELGVSHDSVIQRIRKMEKSGLIVGYTIVLNNEKMNQLNYKVLVNFQNYSKESVKKLKQWLSAVPEVTYLVRSLGEWDLDFEIECSSVLRLREIIVEMSDKFSDIIFKHRVLLIYSFEKYEFVASNYEYEDYS